MTRRTELFAVIDPSATGPGEWSTSRAKALLHPFRTLEEALAARAGVRIDAPAPEPASEPVAFDERRWQAALAALTAMGTWVPNADHGPFNWDSREAVCALKARWAVCQADALIAVMQEPQR